MKLSQSELDILERACEGLSPELVRNIACAYYKEKHNHLKINKSYSYKQENKLSDCKEIKDLIKGILPMARGRE